MAGYRPKSLDELNNLYGKAISAENEIKKSSSLLKDEVLSDIIGGKQNAPERSQRAPEQKSSGFSTDIDDFIRRFSGEGGASSLSETVSKRPASQPPRPETEQRFSAPESSAEGAKQENLSGLMNDYVRIMNGEDDEDEDEEDNAFSSRKPIFKNRRSDKKGKKKNSKDIIQDNTEPALEEPPVKQETPEAFSAPVSSYEPEPYPPFENKAPFDFSAKPAQEVETGSELRTEPRLSFEPQENENPNPTPSPLEKESEKNGTGEDFEEPFERIPDGSEDFVFGAAPEPRLSRAAIVGKIILSVLLVLTLFATVLTGVGVFSVNSERALPGGILTFCATNPYESAEIKSNDFIICKKRDYVNDGEKVIYINRELRSFSFGVKDGEKTDSEGNVYYKVSSETVEKSNVLGVVVKTVPKLGKFVRIVIENYLFVLLGLVALAIALTLIICLAFRKRRYDDYYYDDDFDEDESSGGEQPVLPETESTETDRAKSDEDDFEENSLYSGIE